LLQKLTISLFSCQQFNIALFVLVIYLK
jgi:hypothetical protein